ncbi:hypothetical protein F5Y15DRAFT_294335 [Xylariaceae sp. FL0016]|nr:hypothetical protein F5Y15DRAFT_294335 [Xylariaceae sp. FL0016]
MQLFHCGGLSVYPPSTTTPAELNRSYTAQSSTSSVDSWADQSGFYLPSQPSQPVETIPRPQQPLPAAITADYQPYPNSLCSTSSSSQRVWPTPPPSVTHEGEDVDGYSHLSSPTSGTPGVCPAGPRPVDSSSSGRSGSWFEGESRQMNFPQLAWRSPEPLSHSHMGMVTPTSFEDPYHHQIAASPYECTSFTTRQNMNPDSSTHQDHASMLPDVSGTSPDLSVHGDSPDLRAGDFSVAEGMDEDEEIPDQGEHSEVDNGDRADEPYAKLIYRAFMSRARHAMTLQEIYQWFRENTDKARSQSKGWQNSIRHNLSMNAAFVKQQGEELPESGDNKKSTEWVLEDWAVNEGVQSTTRYRKGTSNRRQASSHHRVGGPLSARATSGRKGGITASKTKAANNRRHTSNQGINHAYLRSQQDVIQTMLHGGAEYFSPEYTRPDLPVSTEAHNPNLVFREPMSNAAIAPTTTSQVYAYGENLHYGQMHNGLSSHPPSSLYPNEHIHNVYQPPVHGQERLSGTTPALPAVYGQVFADAEELQDGQAPYIPWGHGTYQP